MAEVKTFAEIVDYVNEQGQDIEVFIPLADSGSALGGVAAFIDSVDIPVKVRLLGDADKITKVIADKGLEKNLRSGNVEMIPAAGMDEAFGRTLDGIDRGKNQIILKGNSTSDQLMKGLLQQKEKIIDKGNIISHSRLFEMPAGMLLMSDGGINVVSNIADDEKRSGLLEKIKRNNRTLASMFGIDPASMFIPGDAGGLNELKETVEERFSDISTFPRLIQYHWIGPANILYKASASTPWESRFEKELPLSVSGTASVFTRSDTGRQFIVAAPEKGAGITEKEALLREVLRAARELGIVRPKTAILDFTEQYDTFINTPSIAESRELVDRFAGENAVVEGPMAFDLAASRRAAEIKKFESRVSGEADILFMPEFTAGALLAGVYRNWNYLGLPWKAADISFGGPVPILVPSRSDTPEHKLRSVIAAAYISLHIS